MDSKAACDQLNLAQETKTNKRQCPLSSVQVKDLWRQYGRNKSDHGGKDLWKRWVLSLEWKVEAVTDGESEGGDCDEVICTWWGEPGGQWTEWGWRNEEGKWMSLRDSKNWKWKLTWQCRYTSF